MAWATLLQSNRRGRAPPAVFGNRRCPRRGQAIHGPLQTAHRGSSAAVDGEVEDPLAELVGVQLRVPIIPEVVLVKLLDQRLAVGLVCRRNGRVLPRPGARVDATDGVAGAGDAGGAGIGNLREGAGRILVVHHPVVGGVPVCHIPSL
jgi:hypothetical protein